MLFFIITLFVIARSGQLTMCGILVCLGNIYLGKLNCTSITYLYTYLTSMCIIHIHTKVFCVYSKKMWTNCSQIVNGDIWCPHLKTVVAIYFIELILRLHITSKHDAVCCKRTLTQWKSNTKRYEILKPFFFIRNKENKWSFLHIVEKQNKTKFGE